MEFHCWGISHKSTSLEVREKFAFNKDKIDEILAKLKTLTAFDNGIFLSTCNRTEFYSFCPRIEIKKFDAHLEHILGKGLEVRKNDQYLFSDSDAFAHLLRVMTGIDSMIVGEPDIFGQVKKAYENSRSFGYLNSNLDAIFSKSINITKEIRSATNLSKNPISIASLVENIILKEGDSPVLIIGAGDVGRPLLKRLLVNNYDVTLFNRSQVEIEGIKSKPLNELNENINHFKTIVVAAPSEKAFFTLENFQDSEERLIFDLAIPRNLHSEINNIENLKLLTLDQISMMVEENIKDLPLHYQRACFHKDSAIYGFLDLADDNDIILTSDADEIANPEAIQCIDSWFDPANHYVLTGPLYYYYLNVKCEDQWMGTRVCDMKT